ncbi:MAG: hypothetical protein JO020_29775 [Chloroflexi bacterium]|nr:hypothetical protein [Chloroflexota bacterium]MBV9898365.1 hypothetical protein [Chloroflexota bacterium]
MNSIAVETDPTNQKELYAQLNDVLLEQCFLMPIMSVIPAVLTSSRVQGVGERYRVLAYDSVNHGLSSNSRAAKRNRTVPMRPREPIGMRGPSPLQQPLDNETLLLAVGASFTPSFYAEQPVQVDRYLRVRSTSVRLEAQRHPRATTTLNRPWEPTALAQGVRMISAPMQIIVGGLDNLKPLTDYLHELVPSSRYVVLEATAHSAHYERFDEYCAIANRFLGPLGA